MKILSRLGEFYEEFRKLSFGQSNLIDAIVPPVLFITINAFWGLKYALWIAIGVGAVIAVGRIIKRESLRYSLGGFAVIGLSVLIAWFMGKAAGFFLPGIVWGGVIALVGVGSLIARKPMVAWVSHFGRRWPRNWYWRPEIRPAYTETTVIWTLYLVVRFFIQLFLYRSGDVETLGIFIVITGWPAMFGLVAVSYFYGSSRLRKLKGPSVEEFQAGAEPPWKGQQKGF